VLTDMYVQKDGHTRDEERRFIELASWLLSTVDVATRAAVAKKLAAYAEAPRAVVRRLAADEFEVAEPVLRLSPVPDQRKIFSRSASSAAGGTRRRSRARIAHRGGGACPCGDECDCRLRGAHHDNE